MKVAVFGLELKNGYQEVLNQLFKEIITQKAQFFIYKPFYDKITNCCPFSQQKVGVYSNCSELPADIEFIISIGGDGTLLKSYQILQNRNIPVIGINTGRLGFLAAISTIELKEAIYLLFNKQYTIEERLVLSFTDEKSSFGGYNYALNEATLTKLDSSSMIRIHTYLDDEYLTSYWADGLIVSTPTGSTAYSLSVGGPILPPQAKNFVITPISPHNLTMRPLVVPHTSKITLEVEGRGSQFLASLDSRSVAIDFNSVISIEKANFRLKTIKLNGHGFFSTLRNKLMWGSDRRN